MFSAHEQFRSLLCLCVVQRKKINIVWFKRDLRLRDHEPLKHAIDDKLPTLLLYIFEPSLVNDPHYDCRHWRFVWESLNDIHDTLNSIHKNIVIVYEEAESLFRTLNSFYEIKTIYSHEETGIDLTYRRDQYLADFFKKSGIKWEECPTNAVKRGLMTRDGWSKAWKSTMNKPLVKIELRELNTLSFDESFKKKINTNVPEKFKIRNKQFQLGGETVALQLLESFVLERCADYNSSISAPGPSRISCSRLSPHITWGNLSIRQIVRYLHQNYDKAASKRGINSFRSRLGWHCHFVQKFESEPRIEFENMNRGFDDIRTEWDEVKFEAWRSGQTGFPMVDACMRSVVTTGYLNFRMRAMLVSFLTHHLWLHWPKGSMHLAKQFLDFEPGIHYTQFQMQSGTMGVNTIRIYNPVKQGYDHDPEGKFVREWVTELDNVPNKLIHEPWSMSAMEQEMYGCIMGQNYPYPIISDLKESYKRASSILWTKKGSKEVKEENQRILKKHVKNRD